MAQDFSNSLLLLAEDDENDAFFFRRTLRLSGLPLQLHHASNGAVAIEFLQSQAKLNLLPKLFFLDLKMPIMSGFDVLEWLKAQTPQLPVEVIVLSGSDRPEDRERAIKLGAADYLVKPIKPEEFHKILKKVSPQDSPPGQ